MPSPFRGRAAQTVTLPAPVGGWNARDATAAMPITDAREIVNLFPTPTSVQLRKGFDEQANITWVSGGVRQMELFGSFIKYGDSQLWVRASRVSAPTVDLIEDVVSGTEVTSFTGASIGRGYAQFANAAGQFVVVSGVEYWTYNGATWTDNTAAINNQQTAWVAVHQNRIWFVKTNPGGLTACYLATSAITGTPTDFPLGGIATKGGSLSYIATWTMDGGAGGFDDLLVFVTSNGQAIVYEGTDPSSAAAWRLRGVFDVSKPIGAPLKYGADLLLICEDGLYSMSEIIRGNTAVEFTVSDKIRAAWQLAAAGATYAVANVTAAYSPKLNMIVVNFPTSAFVISGRQTSQWFVMNTITKAWTKFTGLDAYAVAEMAGDIYFSNITAGGSSYVYKFGSDGNDVGVAITGYCRQAYTYLGAPGTQKCITGLIPSWEQNGAYTVGFLADWDFADRVSTSTTATNELLRASGSYRPFLSFPVTGDSISVFSEVTGTTTTSATEYCRWFNTTLAFIPGGVV